MSDRAVALTRRGWTLAGAGVGLLLGGWLLGADELTILGLAAFGVLGGSALWATAARRSVEVTRHPTPRRVHVGDPARVELVVRATRATPLLELADSVDGGRLRAGFVVAPLADGGLVEPAYRLPTPQRGPLELGPATVLRTDPLGFARRRSIVGGPETVLVRPRVFAVAPPGRGSGTRTTNEDEDTRRATAFDTGTEFLAVRPYEPGDDPRRVHWRSSARFDELLVRQYVAPRRGRTVVLLDTRAPAAADDPGGANSVHDAFERAVEATASVVTALVRARRPVECLTTSGAVLAPEGRDPQRAMDRLAVVTMDEPDLLDAIVGRQRHRPAELLVVVTAQHDARIAATRGLLGRRMPTLVVVTGGTAPAGPVGAVVDARNTSFPDAWRTAQPRRSTRAGMAPSPTAAWTSAAPSHRPSHSPR